MLYGKAGGAWAHTSYADAYAGTAGVGFLPAGFAGGPPFFAGATSETRIGWTVGTGVEWAFWNNWSAKLEYDYINFGTRTLNIPGAFAPGVGGGIAITTTLQNYQVINEVKFGLNYRFMPNFW